jgi:protein involved in polysaccharide export with SLBB domain
MNYILGPGDECKLAFTEYRNIMRVFPSVEGKVSIQYVGEISVSGISIEAATQKIKAAMSKVYSTRVRAISSCCQSESHRIQ